MSTRHHMEPSRGLDMKPSGQLLSLHTTASSDGSSPPQRACILQHPKTSRPSRDKQGHKSSRENAHRRDAHAVLHPQHQVGRHVEAAHLLVLADRLGDVAPLVLEVHIGAVLQLEVALPAANTCKILSGKDRHTTISQKALS
jgi:hypothetical protein